MKRASAAIMFFFVGCAPLMDAQSDLVIQARKGVEIAQANRANSAAVFAELARAKRQRLDEAFDADVRERADRADLTAEWVVAARAAYAAALDAYTKQDQALRASDETASQNLRAVEAALEQLRLLQSTQKRWVTPPQPEDEP